MHLEASGAVRNMGSADGWHGLTRQQQVDLLAWWRVRNVRERTVTGDAGSGDVQGALREWQRGFSDGH